MTEKEMKDAIKRIFGEDFDVEVVTSFSGDNPFKKTIDKIAKNSQPQESLKDYPDVSKRPIPYKSPYNKPYMPDPEIGAKESYGKLNYELDWNFIRAMAKRMALNKGKYEPYNWQKPLDIEGLKQAMFRHALEVMDGNYTDEGVELDHIVGVALNAMFIYYQTKNNGIKSVPRTGR